MDILSPLLVLPLLAVIFFGGVQLLSKYAVKYRIADDSLQYFLYGLRVWKCPIEDIVEIKIVSLFGIFIGWGLNLISRPFGPYVLLRRRHGRFKKVLLTPPNAEDFVERVRAKIPSCNS
jgi:hypothetical protein